MSLCISYQMLYSHPKLWNNLVQLKCLSLGVRMKLSFRNMVILLRAMGNICLYSLSCNTSLITPERDKQQTCGIFWTPEDWVFPSLCETSKSVRNWFLTFIIMTSISKCIGSGFVSFLGNSNPSGPRTTRAPLELSKNVLCHFSSLIRSWEGSYHFLLRGLGPEFFGVVKGGPIFFSGPKGGPYFLWVKEEGQFFFSFSFYMLPRWFIFTNGSWSQLYTRISTVINESKFIHRKG